MLSIWTWLSVCRLVKSKCALTFRYDNAAIQTPLHLQDIFSVNINIIPWLATSDECNMVQHPES